VNITDHNSTVPDQVIMWVTAIKAARNMHSEDQKNDGCSSFVYTMIGFSCVCVLGCFGVIIWRVVRWRRNRRLREYAHLTENTYATPASTNPMTTQ